MSSRRRRRLDDSDGDDDHDEDFDGEEDDLSESQSAESSVDDESHASEDVVNDENNSVESLDSTEKNSSAAQVEEKSDPGVVKVKSEQRPRKVQNPSFVPRSSRFFLHDDRKGGRGGRGRVVRREDDEDMIWKHDKFDEMEKRESAGQPSPRRGGRRGSSSRRGAGGGGRGDTDRDRESNRGPVASVGDTGGRKGRGSRAGRRGGRGGSGAHSSSLTRPPHNSVPTPATTVVPSGDGDSAGAIEIQNVELVPASAVAADAQQTDGGYGDVSLQPSERIGENSLLPRATDKSSVPSQHLQSQQSQPISVTPLKASAPEFRPSVPHSPSPTAAAMLSSTLCTAQEASGQQPQTRTSPAPELRSAFLPDSHNSSTPNRWSASGSTGTSGGQGSSRYGNIFAAEDSTSSNAAAEDVAVMKYVPNRRSSPGQHGGAPQGRGGGNMGGAYSPAHHQQGMGGAWYPPGNMPPRPMMGDAATGLMGPPMHPQMGYYYPPPADPWAQGGNSSMVGMGSYGPQGGQTYIPPHHHDGHNIGMPMPPLTQGQPRTSSGGHRLHSGAPEFTPGYSPSH